MAERLSLRLGPSRILSAALGGAHILAAGALWAAPVAVAWALAGSLVVAVHLVWVLRHHAWRSARHALVEVEVRDDCTAAVRSQTGEWRTYRVAASTFVSAPLTVLNLRPEHGRGLLAVLITADNVDRDGFRRLRVWLRWRCGPVRRV